MTIELEMDHPAATTVVVTKVAKAVILNIKRVGIIITVTTDTKLNMIKPTQSVMFFVIRKTPARPLSVKCCATQKRKLIPKQKVC